MKQLWKKPVMDHIMWYKEHVLQCYDRGEWNHTPYRHIFPEDKIFLNFIDRAIPEMRELKNKSFPKGKEKICRRRGFDHMNSPWVMALNLFPHLFDSETTEQALLTSLAACAEINLCGKKIVSAWLEEPVSENAMADVCLELDDGTKVLLALFYYNFSFGPEKDALLQAGNDSTQVIFILLRQNTQLNPDHLLETEISEHENSESLHVAYWETWMPAMIALLSGDAQEYAKEVYRKNLDF